MATPDHLLFVYGSLRRGHSAQHRLANADQLPCGELEGVELIENQGDPMLCRGKKVMAGEVDEIDASLLPELDAYEEAPDVYQRVSP